MIKPVKFDICVIGAGAAGLSVAVGASQMGARVVLIEAEKMGGDCLNYGCVPSKALLAAAKTARLMHTAHVFGLPVSELEIDLLKVLQQVKSVIATLAVHDSVERFEKLGVTVIKGVASFQDPTTVVVGENLIKARRFVIATGSSPMIPPIPGLDQVPFYTNETIFDLSQQPQHLIVIGGGPIGCELAQAFLLLGIKVTVLEAFTILPKDEPDFVISLREHLLLQGLSLHEKAKVLAVAQSDNLVEVTLEQDGQQQVIRGSHLLIAAGRRPNVHQLNLEAAGVDYSAKGIVVNQSLRSSNHHIYAMGDIAGPYQFTHVANYQAGIVLRRILFRWPAKVNYAAVPWVTYTHPELAHVGLLEQEAQQRDAKVKVLTSNFSENDRAQTEHEIFGKIKVITDSKGYILGVTILGASAGELLLPWIIAVQEKKHIRSMTNVMVPYPTLSEVSKRVAGEYYVPFLFSARTKRIVRWLSFLG